MSYFWIIETAQYVRQEALTQIAGNGCGGSGGHAVCLAPDAAARYAGLVPSQHGILQDFLLHSPAVAELGAAPREEAASCDDTRRVSTARQPVEPVQVQELGSLSLPNHNEVIQLALGLVFTTVLRYRNISRLYRSGLQLVYMLQYKQQPQWLYSLWQ